MRPASVPSLITAYSPLTTLVAAEGRAVVQGDKTGWRVNGQTAWAWCFRDPRLALFLIDRHCSREVLVRGLGE
jgi:hypothetical protein